MRVSFREPSEPLLQGALWDEPGGIPAQGSRLAERVVPNPGFRPTLSQTRQAQAYVGQYGRETIAKQLAPANEGLRLVPELRPVKRTSWTHVSTFWERFDKAINKYGWILQRITCIVDESGRVRDVLIIDSLPDHILSATVSHQFRFHRWQPATSHGKPVPSVFPIDMFFIAEYRKQAVDWGPPRRCASPLPRGIAMRNTSSADSFAM